jgi:hypothetical protein
MGTTAGKRNLFDTTVLFTPNTKVNYYINYDYGRDNAIGGGHAGWTGIAGAAHIQLNKHFAISPRGEWFDDMNGFATGTQQKIKEATVTGEYKYNDMFISRLEYRIDSSNMPFFEKNSLPGSKKDQSTVTLSFLVVLGPYK